MKNMRMNMLAFLCVGISTLALAKNPEETLKQKVVVALHKVGERSGKLWQRIKGFFKKEAPMPIYKSSIIPLEVKPQYGLECGLCAVENGANAYRYLAKATGKERAGSFENAVYQWYTGTWRKSVMKKFGRQDNLHDTELEYVAKELAKLPREAYTIMPSVKQFNLEFLTNEERAHIVNTITQLREKIGTKHLFIVGNMGQHLDEYGNVFGAEGHWVSAVVERTQDGFNYYTMDTMSMNCPSSVQALQAVIEKHPLK